MIRRITLAALFAALTLAPAALAAQTNHKDIVTTAVEAGSFTTLAAALEAAGLVDVLRGEGPFTVFAAETVAGIAAPIEVRSGEVYVAGAKVVSADVLASNGVIHVIDTVMLPPQA